MLKRNILILGSGSWGTALGQVLSDNGHHVVLYGNIREQINDINRNHKNSTYFKDITINKDIVATNDLSEAFEHYAYPDLIIFAVPTSVLCKVAKSIIPYVKSKTILLNVAKGYTDDGKSMSDILKEYFPDLPILSLLGPSHAEEVIIRKLTFVNIIDENDLEGYFLSNLFNNFYFKTSVINDMKGAELGTSFKNAIALMSGIYGGLGFGDNARAALYTDGLNEMLTLGKILKCNESTLLNYTGAGDLAVTCYSSNSRNFTAGLKIGQLNSYTEFAKTNNRTVEGIRTVKFFYNKAQELKIHLPIISCLYNIIYKNVEPLYAVDNLINKNIGLFDF